MSVPGHWKFGVMMPGLAELSGCGPCSINTYWALNTLCRFSVYPKGLSQTLARGKCEKRGLNQEANVPSPSVGTPGGPACRIAHRAEAHGNPVQDQDPE